MFYKRIILHHSLTKDSGTVSWNAIRRYHKGLGWLDIGYHAGAELVTSGGETRPEILVGRSWDLTGAHTQGHNRGSFGFCFVGNYDDERPPDEMIDMAVRFLFNIQEIFGIPGREIYGHCDFNPDKPCPGRLFPLAEVKRKLR
jgi:N-acetylmuramoyl-L-alanine amidase